MLRISIRLVLIAMVALVSIAAIGIAALEVARSRTRSNITTQVAEYMAIDRNLFGSLNQFRVERGWSMIALADSADDDSGRLHRQIALKGREAFDTAIDGALAELRRLHDAALKARGVELQSLVDEWRRQRPAVDAAFKQPIAARDPSVRKTLADLGVRILTVLEAASDAAEAEIQALEPGFGSFLDARAATWLTRTTTSRVASQVSELMTTGRAATPADWTQLNRAETGALTAWQIAQRVIATAGFDPSVKAAYDRANATYFSGKLADLRNTVAADVSAGRKISIPIAAWDEAIIGQQTLADAAIAVLEAAQARASAAAADAHGDFLLAVATILFAASLAVVAVLIVQFHVVRRLFHLGGAMRRLAEGQLETLVPGTQRDDEIGDMAAAVQVFKDNLILTKALEQEASESRLLAEEQRLASMHQMADAFEQATSGIVGTVSASAGALQATAQTLATTAADSAERSITVAAASEQAASNVGTVAAAAEELGASVQEIGRQVSGSADLARAAVGQADQTAALVTALKTSVSKIGEVVGMISGIAAQTNLLALNATIEAARAGEAGKGFAVVAAEVKVLADQTAKATGEIGQQIGQIQSVTGEAVSAIEAIAGRIREISTVSASIAAAVEEQDAATQEIVRNVGQAASGTSEVTRTITGVAGAAEKTGAAAGELLDSASALSRQSEQLTAEVGRFLATVRAA